MSTARWNPQAPTDQWSNPENWSPAEVPTETACFGQSTQSTIAFSASPAMVGSVVFELGAPTYSFDFVSADAIGALTISGEGVVNRSGRVQCFSVAATAQSYNAPKLAFTGAASAGGSDVHYYAGPESLEGGSGGGVIGFMEASNAGTANFVVRTGALAPPSSDSTVGGEVAFSGTASASQGRFTIYGSLGTDGDTFGNGVFHGHSTADRATFMNIGGTVNGGDGGNTQFYDHSTAATGFFDQQGGSVAGSNGGDVAFDGPATAGQGQFHNHPATATGAYGGVVSFNNNPAAAIAGGASADHGCYHNYGARVSTDGGGGHTEFTAKYGSPTGANATIHNYGSVNADRSSAGHTIFSVNTPNSYAPTAGNAVVWNHPAPSTGGAGGYTQFAIWSDGKGGAVGPVPSAGSAVFFNLGGMSQGCWGGSTSFSDTTTAESAELVAFGGSNGGSGGRIEFYDQSSGGQATVALFGNGTLSVGDHTGPVSVGRLGLSGGVIECKLGMTTTAVKVGVELLMPGGGPVFAFSAGAGFAKNTVYTVLSAPNLGSFVATQFSGNPVDGVQPRFRIVGTELQVNFASA